MRAQIRAQALPIRPTGPGGNAHITYIMDMLVRATHVESRRIVVHVVGHYGRYGKASAPKSQ
jgi:hypothetical protein